MIPIKPNKKIILLGAALLIAVIGYKIGNNLVSAPKEDAALAKQYDTLFAAKVKGEDVNVYDPKYNIISPSDVKGKTYDAAFTSKGPLLTTVPAQMIPNSLSLHIDEKNEEINKTHKILFYDRNDNFLKLGSIEEISHPTDTTTKVSYIFDDFDAATFDKDAFRPTAEIIIHESRPVARILHSSVIEEENQSFIYVARARRDDLGVAMIQPAGEIIAAKIEKHPINTGLSDSQYIAINSDIHPADLILLEPDKKLQDGQLIKINVMKIKAANTPIKTQVWLNTVERETLIASEKWKTLIATCDLDAAKAAKIPNIGDEKPAPGCSNSASTPGGCGAMTTTPATTTEETPSAPETTSETPNTPIDAYELLGIERPVEPLETKASQE